MPKIKLGYAPTRRSIFSAPDAIKNVCSHPKSEIMSVL